MTNNTLLIDAGNSALKWAVTDAGEFSNMLTKHYTDNVTADFFIESWKSLDKPITIIACCVAQKQVWQALVSACHELWEMDIHKVESLSKGYGLVNAYDIASDLGSDRWSAMIGAYHIADSAFIVIDAGSALTIDMVNESGQHLGGYIIPGVNTMSKSLGMYTAQVNVDTDQNSTPSLSLGRSTKECVEAGIYLSMVKMIESVFEKESKQVKSLQCFITGGDAKVIADLLSFKCVMMPDIVVRGLAEIQKKNQD